MDTLETKRNILDDSAPGGGEMPEFPRATPSRHTLSRRRFVQTALALPVLFALPACGQDKATPVKLARRFFSAEEYRFIVAATARLIPGSDEDPGAVQASVPFFIDLQLAGPYGRADRWYMEGPWAKGTEQQGYQLQETPAQLYRKAIAGMDDYCRQRFDGKAYADLGEEDQDQVLHDMDQKKIELKDVPAQAFFALLWQNTQEGFLSDPMYGGNRGFAGWKLIGFPGPRYNYVDDITQYGKPYPMPTVGLLGRDGTRTGTVA
ncbi:gluconate 2-dehydrogenase subunit 3 family protein [Pollutimonas sp. M17]|uniref:gluconate 2-dehydrogenase subunit 3 family protein n=1 Tax=Pollutimonas sp. M17 TaxID=2962065 RepID=UPI0021F41D68|nr:gluconate 2-dehydrogenase subunit 3 family protein [Pollutimonas sp. M17]UYO95418.1 gluconate 2-dehydrogenase subunit 3 family protein [Pollutimonas sp. M17]